MFLCFVSHFHFAADAFFATDQISASHDPQEAWAKKEQVYNHNITLNQQLFQNNTNHATIKSIKLLTLSGEALNVLVQGVQKYRWHTIDQHNNPNHLLAPHRSPRHHHQRLDHQHPESRNRRNYFYYPRNLTFIFFLWYICQKILKQNNCENGT